MPKLISMIIPVCNEEANISPFYTALTAVINLLNYRFEIIYVNDGSHDDSLNLLENLAKKDGRIKIIDLSRNFGKELAMTAGINNCQGDACIIIDADLQHPVEKIPDFIKKWEEGFEVIVGIRKKNRREGLVKKLGAYFFYKIINRISDTEIVPNASDFRLLDRNVIDEFNKFTEKNRLARALIDWLGFRKSFIYFEANPRIYGSASYSTLKLFRLAFNSMVSFSLLPLKLAGYLGIFITLLAGTFGLFIFITKYILKILEFSGPAILATLNLFLIGIVLIGIGLMALYIANIHTEVSNRPLYVIRKHDKI